jgi:hypothetical protein
MSRNTGGTNIYISTFLTGRLAGIALTVNSVGEEEVGASLLTTIVPEEEIGAQVRYA